MEPMSNLQNQTKRDKTHRGNEHECRIGRDAGCPYAGRLARLLEFHGQQIFALQYCLAGYPGMAGRPCRTLRRWRARCRPVRCRARGRRHRGACCRCARLPVEGAVPARRNRVAHAVQRRGLSRPRERRRDRVPGAPRLAAPVHHRRRWTQCLARPVVAAAGRAALSPGVPVAAQAESRTRGAARQAPIPPPARRRRPSPPPRPRWPRRCAARSRWSNTATRKRCRSTSGASTTIAGPPT